MQIGNGHIDTSRDVLFRRGDDYRMSPEFKTIVKGTMTSEQLCAILGMEDSGDGTVNICVVEKADDGEHYLAFANTVEGEESTLIFLPMKPYNTLLSKESLN